MKAVLVSLYNREFAFGIRYISSVLRQAGHDVHLIFFKKMELTEKPEDYLRMFGEAVRAVPPTKREIDIFTTVVRDLSPDLIGFSLTSPAFNTAALLTRELKKKIDIPVVWGGIHPTLKPEECLQIADFACIGEAEKSMPRLVQMLENSSLPSDEPVRGFAFKAKGSRIINGGPGEYVNNLDDLPFPDFYRNIDNKHYIFGDTHTMHLPPDAEHVNYSYNIMTSRGCPFGCTYCCNSVLRHMMKECGRWIRRRSPRSVIEELKLFTAHEDVDHVHFWDDVFTFNRRWIEEFTELYRREIGLPMTCYVHPLLSAGEILKRLKWAGLITANVGLQSGSRRIMTEYYGRKYDPDILINIGRELKELGILAHYDIILDNPYETQEDLRQTLDLLLKLPRPFKLNTFSMCYFPGVPFTERALKDGMITPDQIDGPGDYKGLREFMSKASTKKGWRLFWNTLISMTQYDFFPKGLIKFLSGSKILAKFPRLLYLPVRWILRYAGSSHPLGRYYRTFFPSRLADATGTRIRLERAEVVEGRGVSLSIGGIEKLPPEAGALSVDVYPVYQGRHPDRHTGYANIFFNGQRPSGPIDIELRWPEVKFKMNGRWTEPHEKWIGPFKEDELYKIEVLIYGKNGKVLDRRAVRTEARALFKGENGFLGRYSIGL